MIDVIGVRIQFGSRVLFDDVNIKFTKGNCYGIIGANGAGKSTFLKVLSGEIEPNKGEVITGKDRLSVLNQNQNAFDDETVIRTVLLGHKRLVDIMDEKDTLYAKPDFNDADGIKAANLETEFMDLDGWNAEINAQNLLLELGIEDGDHYKLMRDIDAKKKVKILLAQALFGNPDVLILDEPTNNLDTITIRWLENFLMEFENTVIIVSHNRYFINKVCTHTCDVDYGKIKMYVGNYDFWYETTQLMARQQKEQNKKMETRAKELQEFIARFSANASKSKQATSRKKELERLTIVDIPPSNRKYPYINFEMEREVGNEILSVEHLTKKPYFEDITFRVNKGDKIAFISDKNLSITALFNCICGQDKADSGYVKWGATAKFGYLPQNYDDYFDNVDLNLVQWIGQFSKETEESFLRGWLGRMLFSGEEALKKAKVLSGGEKVRCMLAKTMLNAGNVIIMDEPTNHLDLESITALNKGMTNYKGCIMFNTGDQEIMQTVANRIIEIDNKKVYDRLISFDDYIDNKLAEGKQKSKK